MEDDNDQIVTKNNEELYKEAIENAYLILTDKLTFNELFEYNGCILPYNPKLNNVSEDTFDDMIDYFCDLEEYEKCAEIKKIKDSLVNKK